MIKKKSKKLNQMTTQEQTSGIPAQVFGWIVDLRNQENAVNREIIKIIQNKLLKYPKIKSIQSKRNM